MNGNTVGNILSLLFKGLYQEAQKNRQQKIIRRNKEEKRQEEYNNKKEMCPANEDEENEQIQMAIKQSEYEAKLMLEREEEEERQLQLALKESEKESNKNFYLNDINVINNKDVIYINENEEKEEYDENYGICPITQEYMRNPVIAPSGNYYEKTAIIDWINRKGTDPMTRERLTIDMLIEDNDYKKQIIEYRKKFNK